MAGCASVPELHRAHPALAQRKAEIGSAGLLPPLIAIYEEQAALPTREWVPRAEWSAAAADAATRAFAEEMALDAIPVVRIRKEDPGAQDLAGLYRAVEFSFLRHAWHAGKLDSLIETFPEKAQFFEYSVGPVKELMERYQVDALWIVRGFSVVPTTGARVMDAVETAVGILSALGGGVGPVVRRKIAISVALIDKSGNVIYYGMANDTVSRRDDQAIAGSDFRNAGIARDLVRNALRQYRRATAP